MFLAFLAVQVAELPSSHRQPNGGYCNVECAAYDASVVELKSALEKNDRATIATLFHYPFCLNDDGCTKYESPEEVIRDFDAIFTPRLRAVIERQSSTEHWINYRGAMMGNGDIWYEASCLDDECHQSTPVRIITINKIDLPLD